MGAPPCQPGERGEGPMARWAVELGLVGWCVLCSAGCREPEPKTQHAVPAATVATATSKAPPAPPPVRTVEVVELPEQAAPPTETRGAEPPPGHASPRTTSE